ncbi:hypothetical protein TSAR_008395 [Trichomalopsis sarcophagae]|uniref:Nucleotide exchange factor SIL1 n=1 Tax=Trichomalopsis sarcophagae TaxID=543379 RepID=A0A232F9F1_9HYME|nr:hypothetical protein TSAR_008395 [Trichomalopsis sarcophagae]
MRYLFVIFILAACGLAAVFAADGAKKNDTVFVPTKEWQTVKKGTPIPAGLHIRHNLQTGVTEAKLMDEDESDEKSEESIDALQQNSLTLHPEKSLTDEESNLEKKDEPTEQAKIPFEELKAMLKKMKSDESDALLQTKNVDEAQSEIRKKHRSYSELKKELEALNMNISTDSEVLTSLFSQFESYKGSLTADSMDTNKVEDVLEILNNLEYLIHQIDNAQLFTDMGGMAKIISPSLNSTNWEVKAEALKLLGAAVQSNPKVQLKALESDFVQKILHMLTVYNKVEVKSRCLFALGALVRHFPAAQKALINNGGLEVFGKILIDGQSQVQTRVLNLINDLTIERQNLKEIQDEQQRLRRTKEYDLTNFEPKLLMHSYCQNLVDLMIRSLRIDSDIDDFHEVIYESMITLSFICKDDFASKKRVLLPEIQKMLMRYRDSPKVNEDGENLNLHHQELLEKFRSIISEQQHDEL